MPKLTLWVAGIVLILGSCVRADSVSFSQVDFTYDGVSYPSSEYGLAALHYAGGSQVLYFNLSVNGTWVEKNKPLLSDFGVGVDQQTRFTFDLGAGRGVRVPSLAYGFTIAPGTSNTMPASNLSASVPIRAIAYTFGVDERPAGSPPEPLPAAPDSPDPTVDTPHKHKGTLPNQQTPPGQCVSAAISNSLQYLNSQNNLGLTPADIS